MKKTLQIYGFLFLVIFIILGIFEVNKKPIIDWRKNFDMDEKSPFGLFVFNKEADRLFQGQLQRIPESPYQYYSKKNIASHNIIVVNKSLDEASLDKILNQVKKGSDAFIIGDNLNRKLDDTLVINSRRVIFDSINTLQLTDPKLTESRLNIDKFPTLQGIVSLDQKHKILGYSFDYRGRRLANFAKIKFGKGSFYIHTEPLILTNYYILKPPGKTYVENVFSYLPNRKTLWFVDSVEQNQSSSIMRFILAHEALRNAWWLFLVGLVIFAFFNAKRKQRIVPIIEPLENKSVEFVKSIGNLYLQEGSIQDMMAKKAQYFLHRVRTELLLDTHTLDKTFSEKLHLKTGKNPDDINEALSLIKKSQEQKSNITKEDLLKMNTLLDEILNH